MIITYPIQIPYTLSQQRVVPDVIYNNSEILSGSFPMGKNRFWHGGVHLHPNDRATPIRAIADGELVAYRFDEADATDAFFDKVPYSRSFVLLKHETEFGHTTLGCSNLTFYSLYMHLQPWGTVKAKTGAQAVNFLKTAVAEHPQIGRDGNPMQDKHKRPVIVKAHVVAAAVTADGMCHSGSGYGRVQRGDILGYSGSIPDNSNTPSCGIHFEIFLEDPAFLDNVMKTVWGRCTLTSSLTVHQELFAKETFTVDPSKPLSVGTHPSTDGHKKITVGKQSYWVSEDQITSREVDVADPKHKKETIKRTQYFANTKDLQGYIKNPAKNDRTLAKGSPIIPWLDPWLKAGEFREVTFDNKLWIQVYVPDTNSLYWAEKTAVSYISDADWPNFHKQEEHGSFSNDGFIDDDGVQKLLDAYEKGSVGKNQHALGDDEEKLRHLITKHPTEWSKQDIAKRFGRVAQDAFGTAKLNPDQFAKLTTHIQRLSFWEQVPGLPNYKAVWHAHPIRFIEQLAKCLWLSSSEIKSLMPGVKNAALEAHSLNLNKTLMQWGFSDRLEQTHYLAQGAHESGEMSLMTELPSKYASSASRYKGRGFVQITSETNYRAFNDYVNKSIRTVDVVEKPELLGSDSFLAFAASCWYWRSNDVRRSARKGSTDTVVEEVGRVVNCGPGRRSDPSHPPVNSEDRLEKFHHMSAVSLE